MNKEFVPYEQALALKELWFNEKCLDNYDPRFEKLSSDMETWSNEHFPETLMIPAPLYQQAFRWFREKYQLTSWVYNSNTDKFFYTILQDGRIVKSQKSSITYEEAELACLNKLIEIVKGGKQ